MPKCNLLISPVTSQWKHGHMKRMCKWYGWQSFQIKKYEKDKVNRTNWDGETYTSLLNKHDGKDVCEDRKRYMLANVLFQIKNALPAVGYIVFHLIWSL